MKITFAIVTLCHGGGQRMLAEIVNGMVGRGHEVLVVMPEWGDVSFPMRAPILRVPDRRPGHEFEPSDFPAGDVIVSNFFTTVDACARASAEGKGRHARLSLVYEPCILPDNTRSFRSYHATPHLMVLSRWQRDLVRLVHGVDADIVPVGVDPLFRDLGLRGLGHRPLSVGAVVRAVETGYSDHRQQHYLFDALAEVRRRRPGVSIRLFGPPGEVRHSPSLRRAATGIGAELGSCPTDEDLVRAYGELDVFVSGSTYDAAGLPGLEAMRCGAALATLYAGGNLDYCRPEENCLMSFCHEERLAENILRLLSDPLLRARLAAAGREEAEAWTWERSVDAFEATLCRLTSSDETNRVPEAAA